VAKTEIKHFDPGLLGKYRGKTIVSEDGSYVSYGPGLLAGPTGRGKISPPETLRNIAAGGSGVALPEGLGAALWPLLIPIGIIVLVICLVICPASWLVWRFLRKKQTRTESNESSFRGVGWILLSLFMLVMGVNCLVATAFFFYTTLEPPHSGLLVFLMVLSWSLSLVIGAIDILRQNRAYTVLCLGGVLTVLGILGMYLRPRHDYGQVSTPQISQMQKTIVQLPHLVSKKMDLKMQLAGKWVSVDRKSYIDFNKDGSCLNGEFWADGNWHLERSTLLIRKSGGDFFCGSGSLTLIGPDTVTRDYGMGGEPEVFHRAE
jgi:hypothetical protein